MKKLLILHFFIMTMLFCNIAISSDVNFSDLLTGNWSCESGPCPDEEIAFSIEESGQRYNSWLHARPSAIDGSWYLERNNLFIECCAGLRYEFTIINVTGTELILREQGTDNLAVLRRIQ